MARAVMSTALIDCAQTIEAGISRRKRAVDDGLRWRADGCRTTDVAVAADVLNRMLELEWQECVRVA